MRPDRKTLTDKYGEHGEHPHWNRYEFTVTVENGGREPDCDYWEWVADMIEDPCDPPHGSTV